MGNKKAKNDPQEALRIFDPAIEKLATERALGGKQLYNYKTGRLRRDIRDEVQARAILLRAISIAERMGKKLILSYYEKRLLKRAYGSDAPLARDWTDQSMEIIQKDFDQFADLVRQAKTNNILDANKLDILRKLLIPVLVAGALLTFNYFCDFWDHDRDGIPDALEWVFHIGQ